MCCKNLTELFKTEKVLSNLRTMPKVITYARLLTITMETQIFSIFCKPTTMDTIIPMNSRHSIQHNQPTMRFLINRRIQYPLNINLSSWFHAHKYFHEQFTLLVAQQTHVHFSGYDKKLQSSVPSWASVVSRHSTQCTKLGVFYMYNYLWNQISIHSKRHKSTNKI